MNKILIGIVIILIVVIGGFYFLMNDPADDMEEHESGDSEAIVVENNDNVVADKIFVLTGENFKFMMDGVDNPILRVKEGDTVKIEFESVGGFHDWKIDEFGAATQKVNEGGKTSVVFVANKKGSFEYYCSVGQHRANGMKGTLIVE
ncbi:MAG: hypothetical protein RL557_243 [archaeon]|jgi:plastocyanin